jgi:sugar lactone lactonase YvrE
VGPDGIALDAEGFVWVADANSDRVLRVRPDGSVAQVLDGFDGRAIACAFIGPDLDELLVCCAPSSDPVAALRLRSSRLVICAVDIPGAA